MAAIPSKDAKQKGAFESNWTTLSADDTLTYDATKKQLLVLQNTTAGALTVTIDGDGGGNVAVDGIGSVAVGAGLAIAVPAGESRAVVLSSIRYYLQGVVHLTGAATLRAQVFNL